MNVQRFISGILPVLLYLLTACSVYHLFEGPSLTPSLTPSLPSTTPTPLPSPVPASATPFPTHTPVSPTPTPRPTLTAGEEQAFVREMLATNGGCELPCWWGITPGEDRWSDVRDRLGLYPGQGILQPDGTRLYEIGYGDLIYPPPPPYGYYIHIGLIERDGVVRSITVMGEVIQRTTPERFAQDWRRYSLDQVLNGYGEPSQIYIQLVPPIEPDSPVYYQLWLVYDHLGFYVVYTGPAVYEPPIMRACPRWEEVTDIALRLQSPQSAEPLFESPGTFRTIEETTGMDIRTFWETFRQAEATACLESPAEIWP